jgi:hypothetical protein
MRFVNQLQSRVKYLFWSPFLCIGLDLIVNKGHLTAEKTIEH